MARSCLELFRSQKGGSLDDYWAGWQTGALKISWNFLFWYYQTSVVNR
jgi:hypothetical protein